MTSGPHSHGSHTHPELDAEISLLKEKLEALEAPVPLPLPPPTGPIIAVDADPKTVIVANPATTSFVLADGVHYWDNVTIPRPVTIVGNVDTTGKPKAILDGGWDRTKDGGGVRYPVDSWGSADGGTLRNIEIRNYVAESQHCALNGGLQGWTFDNVHVHHIRWGGVKLDSKAKLLRSIVDHCGQINIKSEDRADGWSIEDTVTEYGNWMNWADWEWEGGGSKFPTGATNFKILRSKARYNRGPGWWPDYAGVDPDGNVLPNSSSLIEDCEGYDNQGPGFMHEVSGPCTYRRVKTWGNGNASNFYVANARGLSDNPVIIEDSTIENGLSHGEMWMKDDPGRPRLQYVTARNNTIRRTVSSNLNILAGTFPPEAAAAPGIKWEGNHYEISAAILAAKFNAPFQNANANKTWQQWQGAGNDVAGTLKVI